MPLPFKCCFWLNRSLTLMNPALPDLTTSPAALAATKICAVMVVYNPDSSLEENIRALLREVPSLIVVDNCSEPSVRLRIAALSATCNFAVVWNKENIGLAAGLNVGIRLALRDELYAWIATFDQDSRLAPGFSQTMIAAYQLCPFRNEVALIAPRYVLSAEC